METELYNPEQITTILHRTRGKIELANNQQFQAFYRPDNSLMKVEIWEERNGLIYRVIAFLGKSILMTNI